MNECMYENKSDLICLICISTLESVYHSFFHFSIDKPKTKNYLFFRYSIEKPKSKNGAENDLEIMFLVSRKLWPKWLLHVFHQEPSHSPLSPSGSHTHCSSLPKKQTFLKSYTFYIGGVVRLRSSYIHPCNCDRKHSLGQLQEQNMDDWAYIVWFSLA